MQVRKISIHLLNFWTWTSIKIPVKCYSTGVFSIGIDHTSIRVLRRDYMDVCIKDGRLLYSHHLRNQYHQSDSVAHRWGCRQGHEIVLSLTDANRPYALRPNPSANVFEGGVMRRSVDSSLFVRSRHWFANTRRAIAARSWSETRNFRGRQAMASSYRIRFAKASL